MHADETGTMVLGVHGTFERAPWLGKIEEDAFSLVHKRAGAYGLEEAPGLRWYHYEADGDWTSGDDVRERCWLQAGIPGDAGVQRLPIVPGITVLTDVVDRVGRFGFTGLHAAVPMHLAKDLGFDLADAADWFSLADPSASIELVVSVSADMSLDLPARADEFARAALDRGPGLLSVRPVTADQPRPGLPADLTGEAFLPTDWNREQRFRCRTREWSPQAAAWIAEVSIDTLREVAPTQGMALLTVSLL